MKANRAIWQSLISGWTRIKIAGMTEKYLRYYLSSLILAIILIAAVPSFALDRGIKLSSGSDAEETGELYLLAIGIDDYVYWPKLRTAVNDARSVAKTLTTDYGFSRANVKTLYNREASESNIIKSLRDFAETLDPSDSLVIFYAGHGILDSLTGKGSWVPVDGSKNDTTSWIKNASIKEILAVIKAKHILLISDSCFAGDIFRGSFRVSSQKGKEYARSVFMKKSRLAMTSGGLEPVTDEGPENHSVFAYYLLKTLERNPAEHMLTSELFASVEQGLKLNKVTQQPILDVLRKTGAEPEGQFVFYRSKPIHDPDEAVVQKKEALAAAVLQQKIEKEKLAHQLKQIEQKQQQLASLESRIDQIKTGGHAHNEGKKSAMDQMYAIALQKQQQADELARLQQEVRLAEERRLREISEAEAEQAAKRKRAFFQDYHKYLKIIEMTSVNKDFKRQAWRELCDSWQVDTAGPEPGYFKWQGNRPVLLAARGEKAFTRTMVLGSSSLVEPGGWYGEVTILDGGRTRGNELGAFVKPGGFFGEASSRMRGELNEPIPEPGGEFNSEQNISGQ